MIEKRTVFILGAGASCPYGFRTARDLRRDIIENFRKNYGNHIASLRDKELVRTGYPQMPTVEAFVRAFEASNTESIDLFLSRQPQFRIAGKLAILLSILRHEGECRFGDRVKVADHDWYFYLYNRLTRALSGNRDYGRFNENRISFITFNYDRSLEHFLFQSLLHSFEGATVENVKECIDGVSINHIYGKLSPLPWQEGDASKVLEYGADNSISFGRLLSMMENLYVVHEERANPELEKARKQIQQAEQVFFLGFGYAKENLEALGFPAAARAEQEIYGTTMGWTEKEIADIRRCLATYLGQAGCNWGAIHQVHMRDCDCVALLRECL